MQKFWTQNNIDILTTYLRNGLDRREIARKMNVSFDAVSGAITRYDLSQHIVPRVNTEKFLDNADLPALNDTGFEDAKKAAKLIWALPKTKRPAKKLGKFETVLLWPDTHVPHHNIAACKSVLQLASDVSFDRIYIVGDYMDLGCISHWNKNKHKTLEMKRLKEDYILGNALLDELDKRLPKNCQKHFLKGNHEEWADQLVEEMPALQGLIEPESMLFLKERGYSVYQYNALVKMGRLYLTHGIYAGGNTIKKHLDDLKVNIAFGHTHTLGLQLSASPARAIAFAGYNIGCLCDLAPDYMRNRPNAWTHGFAVAYAYPNGYFDVELIRIIDGKFIFNNKVYSGNA